MTYEQALKLKYMYILAKKGHESLQIAEVCKYQMEKYPI